MHPAQRCARLIVLVAWMALLAYWSSQGNLPIDQPLINDSLHGFQHRIAHLLAYGLLGVLGQWALHGLPRATVLAVVLASAFGASDEWHQQFTPGRRAAIDDWVVDTASAALALYIIAHVRTTRWQPIVRTLAPLAVAAAFMLGVGLAIRPALPSGVHSAAALRAVANNAIQLVRDTRNAARQFRSTVAG